uniref:Uncharacterized protein n=1 Tax=Parascaris univalens TaxID=6257 RepID=A0A915BV34_PARUN
MVPNDDFEQTSFEDVYGGFKPAIFEMRSAKLNGDDEPTEFENIATELRPAKMKMRTRRAITRARRLTRLSIMRNPQIDRTAKKRASSKSS